MAGNIKISEHAKQRYAERIMGRDTKADVIEFVANNKEKIEGDILKMIEFGDLIYCGAGKEYKKIKLYVNGSWMILLSDDATMTVITLFKKDLGVDDEDFNKAYMGKITAKIRELVSAIEASEEKILEEAVGLEKRIKETEEQILEMRKTAKELESMNEGYRQALSNIHAQSSRSRRDTTDFINNVLGTRVF